MMTAQSVVKYTQDPMTLWHYARPILFLIGQLRSVESRQCRPKRTQMIALLDTFIPNARYRGLPEETIQQAHYVLCVSLDEAFYHSNADHDYRAPSLLSYYHHNSEGGEKFFHYLDQALSKAQPDLPLLVLIYLCLGLGFKGQYGLNPNGAEILLNKRQQIYEVLKQYDALPAQLPRATQENTYMHDAKFNKPLVVLKHWHWLGIVIGFVVVLASFVIFNHQLSTELTQTVRAIEATFIGGDVNNIQGEYQ